MGLRGIQKKRVAKALFFCRKRGQKLQNGPVFAVFFLLGEAYMPKNDGFRF
jgi:hypothetical protein